MKNIYILAFLFISIGNSVAQQVTFQKTYGGTSFDFSSFITQTSDGGYIAVGYISAFVAGYYDVHLMKMTASGDTLWTKYYGGTDYDEGYSVKETFDGGYITVGYTNSFGSGSDDIYLIKTNNIGNLIWAKTYGGIDYERGYSIEQTNDSGYIITGYTSGGFATGNSDVYLIKTDGSGNIFWAKRYGGTGMCDGGSVQQTNDGGYIVLGSTNSFGLGNLDIYLIKSDINGNILWNKTYGGLNNDGGGSIDQTIDGGYIIVGSTNSFGGGNDDILLIKIDNYGDTLWTKTIGGSGYDYGYFVQETTDSGYVITGKTNSFGAGDYDVILIKTDGNGDTLWTKTFGGTSHDEGRSIQQTTDGGFIISAFTYSYGAGLYDGYLIKTDTIGNSVCNQGNTALVTEPSAIQITSPATMVSTGAISTNPITTIGSNVTLTTPCSNVGITSISNINFPISLSPNPATANFTITFPHIINKGVIEIYNVLGVKVMEESVYNTTAKEIRMNAITSGIYVVKVIADEQHYSAKLAVQ